MDTILSDGSVDPEGGEMKAVRPCDGGEVDGEGPDLGEREEVSDSRRMRRL